MPSAVRSGVTIFVLALVTVCVGQYRDENGDHGHAGEIFLYPEDPEHFHHHHHHHHHVHYHDFPSGVRPRAGDSDDGSEEQPGDDAGNFTEIPLEFAQNLNNYSLSDLLLNFVDGNVEDEPILFENRFGGEERSAAVRPKPATCMPELQTIELGNSEDPSIMYIPSCTRIERCGGCCSHSLLTCRPTDTETVSFQVYKTQYTGAKKLKFLQKEIILVEKHTKCKCDCRLQASDCNAYQIYRKNECSCVCTNQDEERKCRNDVKKLWNPEVCACQCREEKPCSTGSYFDINQCKCVSVPMRRRYAENSGPEENERRWYKSSAHPVVPLVISADEN